MHGSKRQTTDSPRARRPYRGADVPMRGIRQFARQVSERFQPEKIILFGPDAYGEPHADSDVDIFVLMPARNELDQAVRISLSIAPPFPLDIDVRTPKTGQHNFAGRWCHRNGVGGLRPAMGQDPRPIDRRGNAGHRRSARAPAADSSFGSPLCLVAEDKHVGGEVGCAQSQRSGCGIEDSGVSGQGFERRTNRLFGRSVAVDVRGGRRPTTDVWSAAGASRLSKKYVGDRSLGIQRQQLDRGEAGLQLRLQLQRQPVCPAGIDLDPDLNNTEVARQESTIRLLEALVSWTGQEGLLG